jgi:hypothetical protein
MERISFTSCGKLANIAKIKEELPKPENDVIFDKIRIQVC